MFSENSVIKKLTTENIATPIPSESRYGLTIADISDSTAAAPQETRRTGLVYLRSLITPDTANTNRAIIARIKRIFMFSS